MEHVSKITTNYAKARRLDISEDFCDESKKAFIWISVDDDSTEPMFSLFANEDGSFTYRSSIWLNTSTREEIPAHVNNELGLRLLLAFVAQDMSSEISECF